MKFCAAKLMGGAATLPHATTITPLLGGVVKGNSKKNSLNYGRGGRFFNVIPFLYTHPPHVKTVNLVKIAEGDVNITLY